MRQRLLTKDQKTEKVVKNNSTADLDTFFHQSPTYVDFFQAVKERGMHAALAERQEKFG